MVAAQAPQTLQIPMFSRFSKTLCVFFRMTPVGFQEGPGRALKVVGAPQLGPREPSGKLIWSIGAIFWRLCISKSESGL